MGGLVQMALFLLEAGLLEIRLLEVRFVGKSRPVFADDLAVWLWPSLVTSLRRLSLRSFCEHLDTDIVFLVGTPDLDGEGFCNLFGNFEFGGRFQNADGADVMLVDAATAANHRQEPARFRLLLPSDGGAKPHTAFRHAMT